MHTNEDETLCGRVWLGHTCQDSSVSCKQELSSLPPLKPAVVSGEWRDWCSVLLAGSSTVLPDVGGA